MVNYNQQSFNATTTGGIKDFLRKVSDTAYVVMKAIIDFVSAMWRMFIGK